MKKTIGVLVICFIFSSCNFNKNIGRMSSEAMLPSFKLNDKIAFGTTIDSFTYGDIVLFENTEVKAYFPSIGPSLLRVVGLPKDSIAIENDICIINGIKNEYRLIEADDELKKWRKEYSGLNEYEECFPNGVKINIYAGGDYFYPFPNLSNMDTIKIPDNHYFVMGDFRSNSFDSRYIGTVSKEKIIGKVISNLSK